MSDYNKELQSRGAYIANKFSEFFLDHLDAGVDISGIDLAPKVLRQVFPVLTTHIPETNYLSEYYKSLFSNMLFHAEKTGIELYTPDLNYRNDRTEFSYTFLSPVDEMVIVAVGRAFMKAASNFDADTVATELTEGRFTNDQDLTFYVTENLLREKKGSDPIAEVAAAAVVEMDAAHETLRNTIYPIAGNFVLLGEKEPVEAALSFLGEVPTIYEKECAKYGIQTNLELIAKFAGTITLANLAGLQVIPQILERDESGTVRFNPNTFKFLQRIASYTVGGCPVVGHTGFAEGDYRPQETVLARMLRIYTKYYYEFKRRNRETLKTD